MSQRDYVLLSEGIKRSQDAVKAVNAIQVQLSQHVPGTFEKSIEDAANRLVPLYDEAIKLSVEEERLANKCAKAIDAALGIASGVPKSGLAKPNIPLAPAAPVGIAATPLPSRKRSAARLHDDEDYDPAYDDDDEYMAFNAPSKRGVRAQQAELANLGVTHIPRMNTPRSRSLGQQQHQFEIDAQPPSRSAVSTPAKSNIKTGADMVVPRGQQVAAKIVQPMQDPSWILASVVEFISATKKYRIKDDDPAEGAFAPEYLVPARNVIWLAEASNLLTPKGGEVLAMYPDCTIFYKATVVQSPEDRTGRYMLFFEGETTQQVRTVEGFYVFPCIT